MSENSTRDVRSNKLCWSETGKSEAVGNGFLWQTSGVILRSEYRQLAVSSNGVTPQKFNMEPENQPLEKEIPIILGEHFRFFTCLNSFLILAVLLFQALLFQPEIPRQNPSFAKGERSIFGKPERKPPFCDRTHPGVTGRCFRRWKKS